jgi:hypothetical protein
MGVTNFPRLPQLAGLCSYEQAAHIGYSVEQNVKA